MKTVEKIKAAYRRHVVDSLIKSDYSYIQHIQLGDIIGRINSDVENAGAGNEHLINGIKSMIVPLFLFVIMISMNVYTGIAFIAPFIIIAIYKYCSQKAVRGIKEWREAFAEMNSETQDLIKNRMAIKAYRLQRTANEWANDKIENFRRKGNYGLGTAYCVNTPGLFVNCLPLFACSMAGASLVYGNRLSIQEFVTMFLLARIAIHELLELPSIFANMDRLP